MKTLVIDAIVGIGFPSVLLADECRKAGLARNVPGHEPVYGNWVGNLNYEWGRDQLEKIDLEKLQELYTALREAREEGSVAEPENDKPLIQLQ